VKDLTWFGPDGREMSDEEWQARGVNTIALRLAGDAIDELGERGEPIVDDTLLMILNAGADPVDFRLPNRIGDRWERLFDTVSPDPPTLSGGPRFEGGSAYPAAERSFALLRLPRP